MKPLDLPSETMDPPSRPGIYVAQPVRVDLVPVTRDARYIDTCARVNCANVKIGKAKDLAIRKRNYEKDFDADNIRFLPLLTTDEFGRAETVILRRLSGYRKRSPKGGPMDWLEGIAIDDAIRVVFSALDEAGISYELLLAKRDAG